MGIGATMEAPAQLDVMTELLELSITSNEPPSEVIGAAWDCDEMPPWADQGAINCHGPYLLSEK